jgi:hypothetical protein
MTTHEAHIYRTVPGTPSLDEVRPGDIFTLDEEQVVWFMRVKGVTEASTGSMTPTYVVVALTPRNVGSLVEFQLGDLFTDRTLAAFMLNRPYMHESFLIRAESVHSQIHLPLGAPQPSTGITKCNADAKQK